MRRSSACPWKYANATSAHMGICFIPAAHDAINLSPSSSHVSESAQVPNDSSRLPRTTSLLLHCGATGGPPGPLVNLNPLRRYQAISFAEEIWSYTESIGTAALNLRHLFHSSCHASSEPLLTSSDSRWCDSLHSLPSSSSIAAYERCVH
eukprot:6672794-Pyramimonas_sp.AAC.1